LAQLGDAASFEDIYDIHRHRVYSLCLRMVHNTSEAEDLTQEAFLSVFRKIHTFRGESQFSTWLYRVAFNTVLMYFRKRKRDEISLEVSSDPDWELSELRHDILRVETGCLSGTIDGLWLSRAVAQLPPGYKTMFVLHDVRGYEHREIAKMVGCSVGNTKSQLHKARLRLRQLLQGA
jgi:RNA polymerase sigma-70 factor (ECF subfamily)